MAEQSQINCKCGYSYITTSISSTCRECGKTNWTLVGSMAVIGVILVLAVLVVLIVGSASWAYYSLKSKLNKWHSIGSLLLGLVSIFLVLFISEINNDVFSIITYLLNTLGVSLSIYNLYKLNQNDNKIKI